jgi:anti-sigma factor RsiW
MTAHDADVWLPFVDAYVDGTLDKKDALRLGLAAERSDALRAEITRARSFHGALAAMPVQIPSGGFEQRILDSVPLARYASAPRRSPVVVALGEITPSFVQRSVVRLGQGLSAMAVAWIIALAVGSTALQGQISAGAAALAVRLQLWSDASAGTPGLASLAAGVSASYDACHGALGSMAGAMGLGLTIFLLGAVLGGFGLWVAARRRTALRDRAGHDAA